MKITIPTLLTLILVSVTIVSITFVAYSAQNYQGSYWQARSALLDADSNNTLVDSITITRDTYTKITTVHATASATNPTDYQGLTLERFDLVIFFTHAGNVDEALFNAPMDQLLTNTNPAQHLGPHSTFNAELTLQLTQAQSDSYQQFNETYNGQVYAHLVLTTQVDSFLDPVFGRMTTLKEQQIPVV